MTDWLRIKICCEHWEPNAGLKSHLSRVIPFIVSFTCITVILTCIYIPYQTSFHFCNQFLLQLEYTMSFIKSLLHIDVLDQLHSLIEREHRLVLRYLVCIMNNL